MVEQLKDYVDYLINNKIDRETGTGLIRDCNKLSREEKNLIFAYVYPRPLGDKELPARVQKYRESFGLPMIGSLVPSIPEATLIVEAERTEQYGKFIRHLIHAFTDPKKINPLAGTEKCDCSICGKVLYENDLWMKLVSENPGISEETNREYLAYGSTDSSVTLCRDCLIQLFHAACILEEFNPEYLTNPGGGRLDKFTWEDLKL